jgi:uncharacterized protein YndB with AHSA1/START domain
MPTADGTLEEIDGRYVLRFERRFAQPVERVWDALTRPEELSKWFGASEIDLELVEGGRYVTRTTGPPELVDAIVREAGEDALHTRDTVLRVEPPRLLEHTFGGDPGSTARWELEPDGDGCRLLLTHTEPPGFDANNAPRDLGGWHTLLDLMERTLAGAPVEWRSEHWEAHRDRYAAQVRSGQ